MFNRTPGKWRWAFSKDPDTFGMAGIFVEGEDGPPLQPQVGDMQLMAYAPEMHELLYKIADELNQALVEGIITAGIHNAAIELATLLKDINVERQKSTRKELEAQQ